MLILPLPKESKIGQNNPENRPSLNLTTGPTMNKNLEKLHAEALAALLCPTGSILQIGFDTGALASCIQAHGPVQLTLIETDPLKAEEATRWAKDHPTVMILQGRWQTLLSELGMFDLIVVSKECGAKMLAGFSSQDAVQAGSLLKKERELRDWVEEKIPQLAELRYSDCDLETFVQNIEPSQRKQAACFLSQLKKGGQISEGQYEKSIEKYQLPRELLHGTEAALKERDDPLFPLLTTCLERHMSPSARFIHLLNEGVSYYENPQFFEQIITNPYLDYQEKSIGLADGDQLPLMALWVEKLE